MAVFGVLGLRSAVLLTRGIAEARSAPILIGAAYVLFGMGAVLASNLRPHFLLFVFLGALLLGGTLLWSPGTADGSSPSRGQPVE